MDRYSGFDEYVEVKSKIFSGDGIAIVNRSDEHVMRALPAGKPFISFGGNVPATAQDFGLLDCDGETWLVRGEQKLLNAEDITLAGRHNLLNVLAAMALADHVGVEESVCIAAARQFQGLPHRMELVAKRHGVSWINDSKATNVGAAVAALEGLSSSVILIVGGDGKGADFTALKTPIARHARAVILIGRDADRIAHVVPDGIPMCVAKDMREAVNRARSLAVNGDYVLLSPACASFDMYSSFEQRGDDFKSLVHELV